MHAADPGPIRALLGADDPPAVGVERPEGRSDLLLVVDHAGNAVPRCLDGLGVAPAALDRHLGYDIGALDVALAMSRELDAAAIFQRYSRLVIDCNRPPHLSGAFPTRVDGVEVPGNHGLAPADAARRVAEIFHPYHAAIVSWLDRRAAQGRAAVVVALHSFTPVHGDFPGARPWHVAVLFNRERRLARPLIAALEAEPGLVVGVNQPYRVDDEGDYAIPVHGERRGLLNVEIEIRQDLIADAAGQRAWAARLARLLPAAVAAARAG